MVVVESKQGPFQIVELYYPGSDEVREFAQSLTMGQIVYMRQMPASLSPGRYSVSYIPFSTSLFDLTRDEKSLYAGMSRTCRRQMMKAERLSN
jgi:hypothetical protein